MGLNPSELAPSFKSFGGLATLLAQAERLADMTGDLVRVDERRAPARASRSPSPEKLGEPRALEAVFERRFGRRPRSRAAPEYAASRSACARTLPSDWRAPCLRRTSLGVVAGSPCQCRARSFLRANKRREHHRLRRLRQAHAELTDLSPVAKRLAEVPSSSIRQPAASSGAASSRSPAFYTPRM